MNDENSSTHDKTLLSLLALHCAASLVHFVHNAVYLKDYPSVPSWLTASGIYVAWILITSIGVVGYALYSRGSRMMGLAIIALYALFGFGGFDHYIVAPIAAHTATANTTIAIEAGTAAVLLVFVALRIRSEKRESATL